MWCSYSIVNNVAPGPSLKLSRNWLTSPTVGIKNTWLGLGNRNTWLSLSGRNSQFGLYNKNTWLGLGNKNTQVYIKKNTW